MTTNRAGRDARARAISTSAHRHVCTLEPVPAIRWCGGGGDAHHNNRTVPNRRFGRGARATRSPRRRHTIHPCERACVVEEPVSCGGGERWYYWSGFDITTTDATGGINFMVCGGDFADILNAFWAWYQIAISFLLERFAWTPAASRNHRAKLCTNSQVSPIDSLFSTLQEHLNNALFYEFLRRKGP